MLCSACTNVFQGDGHPWYWYHERGKHDVTPAYEHHPSPAYLEKAVRQKCRICSIIWKKLTDDEKHALRTTWRYSVLHRTTQQFRRLWGPAVAHYTWSPVYWDNGEDVGISFQFGDYPFWKKIVFRLLPTVPARPRAVSRPATKIRFDDEQPTPTDIIAMRIEDAYQHTDNAPPPSPLTMWSPHAQKTVKGWFHACTRDHKYCLRANSVHPTFHPTRILDIAEERIKLNVDKDSRIGQRYATLTHRWSSDPSAMPQLSGSNLEGMRRSIDPSILSPTFRDVIEVTRQLGIRYIWIDSLCIIQSGHASREDWQKESATMGDIYQNAFVNIQAGTTEAHSASGLFGKRIQDAIEPYQIEVSRTFASKRDFGDGTDTHMKGKYSVIEEDFARDELVAAAINQRGWVLQERLLSGRIVHFGSEQIFWECHQILACEMFPSGLPKNIPKAMARANTVIRGQHERNFTLLNRMSTHTFPPGEFKKLGVHKDFLAWFYVVELYSTCSLTRESDKLIALSGVAKIFAQIDRSERASDVLTYLRSLATPRLMGTTRPIDALSFSANSNLQCPDDYLAGVWGRELLACLLWHVLNGRQANGQPAVRLDGERAPSWSWASMNARLHASIYQNWDSVDGRPLVQIHDSSVEAVSAANIWGQVRAGKIRLSGRIIHERFLTWPNDTTTRKVSHHISEFHASMIRRIKLNSASVAYIRILKADVVMYIDDLKEFDSWHRRADGVHYEIALLPLIGLERRRGTWSTPEGYIDEIYQYHGLVLALKLQSPKSKANTISNLKLTKTSSPSLSSPVPDSSHVSSPADNVDHTLHMRRPSSGTVLGYGSDADRASSEENLRRTYKARRLGYFRVHDTEVFGNILERDDEVNVVLI